jgi:hypothetical protein
MKAALNIYSILGKAAIELQLTDIKKDSLSLECQNFNAFELKMCL